MLSQVIYDDSRCVDRSILGYFGGRATSAFSRNRESAEVNVTNGTSLR